MAATDAHIFNQGEYINDYEHFTVLPTRPNEISDPCDICKISSVNPDKKDELVSV